MSDPAVTAALGRGGKRERGARERVLRTAYELFCRHGVQAVGVDRIAAEAGVTKTTLYKHFRSKQALIIAVLDLREELWLRGWLQRGVEERAETARGRVLAIFDLFEEWFRRADYESCLINNTLSEIHDPTSPVRQAAAEKRANIRSYLSHLAEQAGAAVPERLARELQLLMTGAIVAADEGDLDAAQGARRMAGLLLDGEGAAG